MTPNEHDYYCNYTEEELGDVLEEMGKTIDPIHIPQLKFEIDRVVDEIDKGNEECYETDMSPLFSSLRLDDTIRDDKFGTQNIQDVLFSNSPIKSTRQNVVTNAQVIRNQYLKSINSNIIPLALQTNDEDDEMRQYDPTAHVLLNDAYRCLGNVYRNFHYLDMVTEYIQDPLKSKSFSSFSNIKSSDRKEKQVPVENDRLGSVPRAFSTEPFSQPEYQKTDYIENKPDPSIRPILHPAPGQLAYRHDPVKKFELYREEWARRPAPGDEKRLALRWKVREYMLRQDFPKYDPSKGNLGPVSHPKDWSPRAYLV